MSPAPGGIFWAARHVALTHWHQVDTHTWYRATQAGVQYPATRTCQRQACAI